MPETLLSVENLSVQYGRFLAVDDLSFELGAGQLLGLIGPNGAGKTSTIRAIAGLQAPTSGRVRVLGHDVFADRTIVGHHLGYAPDNPAVYDALTVEQFLQFIGRCYSLKPNVLQERIDLWLEVLWLSEKRGVKVSALSRGMRQRLAVLRTLMPDPHVILLDEPAAGLDPAGRMYFRRMLAGLRDQGKALIVSSHILADLSDYCTHVLIMERGRARSFGSVESVAGAADASRSMYRVQLAYAQGDAAARLGGIPNLTRVAVDGAVIDFEFDRERAAAAELLKQLIAAGLAVAEFRPIQPDLEQAYIRTGIGQVD